MRRRRPVRVPLYLPVVPLLALLFAVLAHAGLAATTSGEPPEVVPSTATVGSVAAVTPPAASDPCVDCDDADGSGAAERAHQNCTSEQPCHTPRSEHGPTENAVRAVPAAGTGEAAVLPVCTVPLVRDGTVIRPDAPAPVMAAAREPVAVLCVNRN